MPYPFISSGTPILQQFFASKYTGVAALSFDDGGALTGASGESIPNGLYYPNNGTSDAVMGALSGSADPLVTIAIAPECKALCQRLNGCSS